MTDWEVPQADALNAVSVTNTGTTTSTLDHHKIVDEHAFAITVSGFSGGGALFVFYQGSLDGTEWYTISYVEYESSGVVGGSLFGTSTTPARFTQITAYTTDGSTSATVTASAVSGSA